MQWCKGIFEDDEFETYYAELIATFYVGYEPLNYIQFSNRIEAPEEGEQVHFWIKHVNGTFDVKIAKLDKVEEIDETIKEGEVV